jgi:hypothetical protein
MDEEERRIRHYSVEDRAEELRRNRRKRTRGADREEIYIQEQSRGEEKE